MASIDIFAATFLDLSDTPSSFAGASGFAARVNAGETALEYVDIDPIYVNVSGDTMTGALTGPQAGFRGVAPVALSAAYAPTNVVASGITDSDHTESTMTALPREVPHDGSGKIEARAATWPGVVPSDVARAIVDSCPGLSKMFGHA